MRIVIQEQNQQQADSLVEDYAGQGSPPDSLTHDPTQGLGTSAWQLSVKHNMEVNARNRRN